MAIALLIAYIALVVAVLFGALVWSRRKQRTLRNSFTAHKWTAVETLFFKELPKGWYVSVQFCVGFALAGLAFVVLFEMLVN